MYMLHLFDADAAEPIEARFFPGGRLRIGRDRSADWPITDPDQAISRAHLELCADGDGIALLSIGANGVFDAETGQRFPDRVPVPVSLPGAFRLGRFRINATRSDSPPGSTTVRIPAPAAAQPEHDSAPSLAPAPQPLSEGSLLEAFCEGAGLDASQLSAESPAAIMRRAGAVYREMVGGLSELVQMREKARERHHFVRTTIAGVGNNPFKWGPAQRLAVDLLTDRGGSFLSGPVALRASFADVRRHMTAATAGHDAVVRTVMEQFDPQALDEAVAGQASLMRSRASLQMAALAERHADLGRQLHEDRGGLLDQAYVAGYDAADR